MRQRQRKPSKTTSPALSTNVGVKSEQPYRTHESVSRSEAVHDSASDMTAESENANKFPKQQDLDAPANSRLRAEPDKVPDEEAQSACADPQFDEDGVPFDRGWAWMIVFGSFVIFGLVVGYTKSNGIFFEELLQFYRSTHTHTALLFAIRGASYSIGGLFIMNIIVGRLGVRKTVLIGAVCLSLSAILSSVASQLTLLLTLQATLLGLADVMMISPAEVLIARYFRRRRFMAFAMVKCGASVGGMAFPPLVTFFLSEYGLKGAFLLTGAVCLHGFPAAFLLRPTSYFSISKRRSRQIHKCHNGGQLNGSLDNQQKAFFPEKPSDDSAIPLMSGQKEQTLMTKLDESSRWKGDGVKAEHDTGGHESSASDSPTDEDGCGSDTRQCTRALVRDTEIHSGQTGGGRDTAVLSNDKNSQRLVSNVKNVEHEVNHSSSQTQVAADDATKSNVGQAVESGGPHRLRSAVPALDFSLFRRPVFRLLFVCFALFPTVTMSVDYLPALAEENGVSKTKVASLLTIIGACDFLSRFSTGVLADRRWLRLSTIIAVTFVVLGVTYHCVRFLMTSFSTLVVAAVIQGLMGGVVNCLIPGVVVECVGVDKMAKGLGFYQLAAGSFQAAANPLMGYIRDVTGSYVVLYHVFGSLVLLAAVLLCFEGPLTRRQEREERRKEENVTAIRL